MKKYSLILSSSLFGIFSFLFVTHAQSEKELEFLQFFFLVGPAIIFPVLILMFSRPENPMMNIVFVLASSLTYHASAWIASNEVVPYSFIAGGITGATFMMCITIYVLNATIRKEAILVAALIGGLSFVPWYYFLNETGLGLSLLLWMAGMGALINFSINRELHS